MPSKAKNSKSAKDNDPPVKTAAMRSPYLYVGSVIILIIIIIAFVAGPLIGGAGPGASTGIVFGSFRGQPVELAAGTYFAQVYQSELDRIAQQAEQQNRAVGLPDIYNTARSAFDAAVIRFAFLDEAQRAGVFISDEQVTDTVIQSGSFVDEQGEFSLNVYQRALENNPNLKEQFRENLVASQVAGDLFSASLSEAELDFIAAMGDDRRIFDIVSFEFDAYPDSEVVTYFEENSQLFQRIDLSSITVNTLEEAEEALARLESGEISFSDLAIEISTDLFAADGGSRGPAWYYDVQRDFEDESAVDLLFALEMEELSEIFAVRGDRYAIFTLNSEIQSGDTSDPELIDGVRSYVLGLERGRVADYFRVEAESVSARIGEIGWASAVVEAGLTVSTTSSVAINYGDIPLFPNYAAASQGLLDGISSRDTLLTELFSLEEGESSSVVELRDRVVIMRYVQPGEQTSGQNDFLRLVIPQIAQNELNTQIQRIYSSPDNLRDEFDDAFSNAFLSN